MNQAPPLKDTRNAQWAADKSKFGFRMLQKMGWKEGKGLGRDEDGVTEHVRVRKRLTNAGVGAAAGAAHVWSKPAQVAAGLNDVLARLAPVNSDGTGKHTTKKTAKRARGYYERRVAGKNVKAYSESALREIFGGVAPGRGEGSGSDVGVGDGDSVRDAHNVVHKDADAGDDAEAKARAKAEKAERKRLRRERRERKAAKKLGVNVEISKEKKSKKEKKRKRAR